MIEPPAIDPASVEVLRIPDGLRRRAAQPDGAPDCEWLAEHGEYWHTGADPEGGVERMVRVRRRERMRFPRGRCFNNVRRLTEADPWFRYVEGVALKVPGVADWHAWAATPHGFVVDPTWHPSGFPPEAQKYFGVEFSQDDLARHPEAFDPHDGMVARMVDGERSGGTVNLMVWPTRAREE